MLRNSYCPATLQLNLGHTASMIAVDAVSKKRKRKVNTIRRHSESLCLKRQLRMQCLMHYHAASPYIICTLPYGLKSGFERRGQTTHNLGATETIELLDRHERCLLKTGMPIQMPS